jgi:ribosomal protein S18 acetylase RimI-like enzyme
VAIGAMHVLGGDGRLRQRSAMPVPHPLDRPVWNALTTRQAAVALGDVQAWRFDPDYALFAAARDFDAASIGALVPLVPAGGMIGLVEARPVDVPPGLALAMQPTIDQMLATAFEPEMPDLDFVDLSEGDAADMLELATLTEPGPFFAKTHRLGDFIGVKRGGRLIAMAGERMKLLGFTEVSAVCTHPEGRGQGLGGKLTRIVASRIAARGEVPFLHVYPHNTGAITLYQAMGFSLRRTMVMTVMARQ